MRAETLCTAALFAAAAAACGLLAPPGDYASGDAEPGASDAGASDAREDGPVVLPDGSVVGPTGSIAVLAGERDPSGADDNPAWSSDCWVAALAEDGRVLSWSIREGAPVVGPFDATTVLGGAWVSTSFGFGIAGNRSSALQIVGWSPGPAGAWRASRASMPGGLDEIVRVFFGAHLAIVGGTRTFAVDGGTSTAWTDEVHVADLDVTEGRLGATKSSGKSLVVARSRPGVLVSGGKLYVAGGRTGPGATTASVEMAAVDPQAGTISDFEEQPALANDSGDVPVIQPALVAASGWLFAAGGRINASGTPSDVVLASKIDAGTGALGPFRGVASLPRPLRDFAFVARGETLYVIGGQGASGRSADVWTAKVSADGGLSAWESAGNAKLPAPRSDVVGVAF